MVLLLVIFMVICGLGFIGAFLSMYYEAEIRLLWQIRKQKKLNKRNARDKAAHRKRQVRLSKLKHKLIKACENE